MKILTAAEMAACDRRSVAAGVPVRVLMENAGAAVARFCLQQYPKCNRIAVLCGKGNNGGDGLVAARHLRASGCEVSVLLLGAAAEMKGDAAAAWSAAGAAGVQLREAKDEGDLREALRDVELVLDAVVGTGFKPPLRGPASTARDVLREMAAPVIAVDLPSGWDADSLEQKSADAFRADAVVTFVAPKQAHVFGQLTKRVFGPVVVASIGEPAGSVESATQLTWAGSAKAIAETPRDVNGNKGKFGHVLVVGGSWGKSGAPSMSSLACLRAGAGLVTAAIAERILPSVASITPELMCVGLEENAGGGLSLNELKPAALEKLLKGISVAAIGPGLGQEGTTPEFVHHFVERASVPMVIDADALNAFSGKTELLHAAAQQKDAAGKPRVLVLTPHPGEMARLIGGTVKDVEADRIGIAREFATKHGVTLVLKGWRTLVAHPDGRIAVNTTGNPSMAKGGSGDILTGIVAAMLVQYKHDVASAVEAAVFLHGLAGDFACQAAEEHTVLATDTVAHLADAFHARVKDGAGFTWIAGAVCNKTAARKASR